MSFVRLSIFHAVSIVAVVGSIAATVELANNALSLADMEPVSSSFMLSATTTSSQETGEALFTFKSEE